MQALPGYQGIDLWQADLMTAMDTRQGGNEGYEFNTK